MQDFFFLKVENFYFKLEFSDIFYIQAEKKYIVVATANSAYVSLVSISHIEKLLPKDLFCRVHRSYIISLEHLHKFDNQIAHVGCRKIPIAKQFKEALKEAITIINGEVRCHKLDNGDVDKLLRVINPE